MRKYLLIFALLLFFNKLYAQHYYFTHFQVENGLSNNTVLCSLQDKQGFMWFGTKDGLNRFDGYTFKIFRNNPKDTTTIGNNVIRCLYKDDKGNLWVGTEGGLFKYNAVKENFAHVQASGTGEIMDVKCDSHDNLWFIGGFVLNQYNLRTGYHHVFPNTNFGFTSLCFIHQQLWLSTTNGFVEQYDAVNHTFKTYSVFTHSAGKPATWIQKIVAVNPTTICVGTSHNGLKLFNTATGTYQDLLNYNADHTEIFVRDIVVRQGKYWIGTESGVYIYDPATGHIDLLRKHYNDPYSLSDNAVYTFCIDREGGIWIGTYFGGMNYYASQYTTFEKFFPETGENSLSGNAVREICSDSSHNIWIGTEDGGLNQMTPDEHFYSYKPLAFSSSVSSTNIHGMLVVGSKLLIGTFENGLDEMDLKTHQIIRHYEHYNTEVIKSDFFDCIYQTREGGIITATTFGVYNFDLLHQRFSVEHAVPENLFYTTILEDHEGTRWIGSFHDGLYYYNPVTKKQGVYNYNIRDSLGLSDNHINKLLEDSDNRLWIATENGLCQFNRSNRTFTRYSTASGFPSNIIYAMLEDDHKNLWITTSKGLVCMNLRNHHLNVYTTASGLLSDQFNYSSAYKDGSGNLYFGCLKGMIRFNPTNLIKANYDPPVYLTNFQINNKDLEIGAEQSPLSKSITFTDSISLKYNQASFSIDFAALSYAAPQVMAYAYKMDGLDKDWTYLKSNRKVYFTKLSPGTYIFNVKALTGNGDWNKNITRLTIIIHPPFWLSKKAFLLYALIIIAIVYELIRRYHARIEKANRRRLEILENEKQKEIYNAKIAFFTHIAHEIRTPLTLIKGPMETLLEQSEEIPSIQKNLKRMERNILRLLKLTTQLLDFRKTEIQGFSLNFVKADIAKIVNDNLLIFESSAEQRNLKLNIRLPDKPVKAYVDTEALNKILSNLLNNAFKYAESGVTVIVEVNAQNTFSVIVKNDGNLIDPDLKERIFEPFFRIKKSEKVSGTGIGLSLARSLAELHKGTIELLDNDEKVNIFILTLPVRQEIEFDIK